MITRRHFMAGTAAAALVPFVLVPGGAKVKAAARAWTCLPGPSGRSFAAFNAARAAALPTDEDAALVAHLDWWAARRAKIAQMRNPS